MISNSVTNRSGSPRRGTSWRMPRAPVYAQEFANRIPGARVELVDQAGHMPSMEQPAHVATLVREFCWEAETSLVSIRLHIVENRKA